MSAPRSATESTSAPVPRAGTVALVGRPNVGKSTLVNALLGERIAITSPHPQTTRDRIAGIVMHEGSQLVFYDTPGIHRARHKLGEHMNALSEETTAGSDVVVFVTEVAEAPGPVRVSEEDQAILRSIPDGAKTILVLNKIDRLKPKSRLLPALETYGRLRDFAAVIPVSALARDGVARIVEEALMLLPEGPPLYDPEEISDKPLRFFVAELVREQILRRTQKEVPHGVAVSIDTYDDGPDAARVAVTIHVARESHKAILIGKGGAMLAAIGQAARKRAERLLGRPVHLTTYVRATPGWFDDPRRLSELGYEGERPKRRRAPRAKPKPKPKPKERTVR